MGEDSTQEMVSPSHKTSGVRSRRAHRDLCCNLNLGHPSMASVRLAASMWHAGAVAPCQCVGYFTHLKGEMTQAERRGGRAIRALGLMLDPDALLGPQQCGHSIAFSYDSLC